MTPGKRRFGTFPIKPLATEYQRHQLAFSASGVSTCGELPTGVARPSRTEAHRRGCDAFEGVFRRASGEYRCSSKRY